jgi:hypothetical protein
MCAISGGKKRLAVLLKCCRVANHNDSGISGRSASTRNRVREYSARKTQRACGAITEAAPAESPSTASVAQKGGRAILPEGFAKPAEAHFFEAPAVLATVTEPLGLCAVPWQASTQVLVVRVVGTAEGQSATGTDEEGSG